MFQKLRPIKTLALFFFFVSFSTLVSAATLRDTYEAAVDAYNKGQYDQAISIYEEINKQTPEFAPAYIGLGLALKARGADADEILYYYKVAVEKDPTSIQALEQLGRLYYAMGRLDNARASFERALKINSQMPSVKLSLAWIYLVGKKANPEKAIIYFQDVLKSTPIPNAYFGLGMAYFAVNKREKALEVITQLKDMGQKDLAEKLEKSVRENRKITINESDDSSEDQDNPNEDKNVFEKTSDTPKGIKVRLRGKLDNL